MATRAAIPVGTPPPRRRVLVLDPNTRALIKICQGPDPDGECPLVRRGRTVPCAGKSLIPSKGTGLEGWRFDVAPGYAQGCPLRWLLENVPAPSSGEDQAERPARRPDGL